MSGLSKQLKPFKQGAIEHLVDCGSGNSYDEIIKGWLIVEPRVLKTDERIFLEYDLIETLQTGEYNYKAEECEAIIEYVRLEDLVKQLPKEDLIQGLLNLPAISELEARYPTPLHLKERILLELRALDSDGIYAFANSRPTMTVKNMTGQICFSRNLPEDLAGCDVYDTYDFVKLGSDYNAPERDIYCGYQFVEAPIIGITREDLIEY